MCHIAAVQVENPAAGCFQVLGGPPGPAGRGPSPGGGCEHLFQFRPGGRVDALRQQTVVVHFGDHSTTISLWSAPAYLLAM